MHMYWNSLGWTLLSLAAVFSLGAAPWGARCFYPKAPSLGRRLAAPILFLLLALACFAGIGFPVMVALAVVGGAQAVRAHRCCRGANTTVH